MYTDPARRLITAHTGPSVGNIYYLYDLYDLDPDLSEVCVHFLGVVRTSGVSAPDVKQRNAWFCVAFLFWCGQRACMNNVYPGCVCFLSFFSGVTRD